MVNQHNGIARKGTETYYCDPVGPFLRKPFTWDGEREKALLESHYDMKFMFVESEIGERSYIPEDYPDIQVHITTQIPLQDDMTDQLTADIFEKTYLEPQGKLKFVEAHYTQGEHITATVKMDVSGQKRTWEGVGNGRLDAVSNAIKTGLGIEFHLETYTENAVEQSSKSKAAAYIGISKPDGSVSWGAGIHTDIIMASVRALVAAVNNSGLI